MTSEAAYVVQGSRPEEFWDSIHGPGFPGSLPARDGIVLRAPSLSSLKLAWYGPSLFVVVVVSLRCNAMQYNAMHCYALQCNAVQCSALQANAMQCTAMKCNAMQSINELQCNALQCNVMQFNALQLQCNAIQCNAGLADPLTQTNK